METGAALHILEGKYILVQKAAEAEDDGFAECGSMV